MRFTKMSGAGNDFILLNNLTEHIDHALFPSIARTLCRRHLSIGADGLMVVESPLRGGDYRMLFYNADGSAGEMCGDAEDAAQTVFRKVMERTEPFRDPEHEKAWLIVTARNECRNQLKHWWRTRRAGEELLDSLAWEQPRDGEIWEQVAGLPEPQRLVLYLHYYQGYTTGEISDMLRENHSTVRSRLVQARKKLKLKLEEEGYGQT